MDSENNSHKKIVSGSQNADTNILRSMINPKISIGWEGEEPSVGQKPLQKHQKFTKALQKQKSLQKQKKVYTSEQKFTKAFLKINCVN